MDVEFYKTASGREVVAEFLDTLPAKDMAKVFRDIDLFYFIWRDNKLVLLHGFTKKTQKTPPREIQTAKTRLADYEARYGTNYS